MQIAWVLSFCACLPIATAVGIGGVVIVVILGVQMLANHSERFAEALEVDDFALPQETDRRDDIGVIHQLENVVVGRARLLLCYYHVFATKLSLAKVRKILIFQGVSALLKLTIFQKFQ